MRPAGRGARGVALLLAVLVVAVLTLMVVPFFYDGRVEQAVAANLYTSLQASYLARGGVTVAEALLQQDLVQDRQRSGGAYDALTEEWSQFNGLPIAAAGGQVAMSITDEAGKVNLNAVGGSGEVQKYWQAVLQRLLVIRGQDESAARALVDTLVDWIDADDQPTGFNGAERAYYQSLDPPDAPPNAPLTTTAELRRVKGWDQKVIDAVAPFVTVWPRTAAQPRVNINTAPPEVLQALDDAIDETRAEDIVEYRKGTPFRNATDIRNVPGLGGPGVDNLVNRLTTTSTAFSVTAIGSFRESVSVVRVVLGRENGIQRRYWREE